MSTELTIGLIVIGVAIIVISGYFIYRAITKKKDSDPSPGPSPGPSPTKTTIVIDENGSSFKTEGTETYLEYPRLQNCRSKLSEYRPSFCENITVNSGADYVYNPEGDMKPDGRFITGFNKDKYECADGSTDCIYEDVFNDSGDTVIGIENSNGEDLVEKLKDDIWSGKFDLNREVEDPENPGQKAKLVDLMVRMIDFDEKTGILSFRKKIGDSESVVKIIPGAEFDEVSSTIETYKTPVGNIVIYILFYYYTNGLDKPEIEINVKQEKTFGKLWTEFVSPS